MDLITFVDTEIGIDSGNILDLGAIKDDGTYFHSNDKNKFKSFVKNSRYICGHNIVNHDLKYIDVLFEDKPVFIDTLYLSPLLFAQNPYHRLLKDDKLHTEELNNPLSDSKKCMDLFYDEVNVFKKLDLNMQIIYCSLLYKFPEFKGFFVYNGVYPEDINANYIKMVCNDFICSNADIGDIIKNNPIELAYALAISKVDDRCSVTPPWIMKNYPLVENIVKLLRNTPCEYGCKYCDNRLDARVGLKEIFGYDGFRKYNNEPLQENAVKSAIKNESLLAIFPTGGGKSITFQLPALIAGRSIHAVTVVISPLQSLMKDQVDNLEKLGILDAVTINGMLSPIERSEAINRLIDGTANILYISPEQLRSNTIERVLINRTISRFVIDEAHCFSSWGHDFRIDYLYIADFIKDLQKSKNLTEPIPVSCFTATAKQKVISDILDYFNQKLGLDLKLYTTNATRENLKYSVLYKDTEDDKYSSMRELILANDCSTIVYVSTTGKTVELAEKLNIDGIKAGAFNGKMDTREKIENQEMFIKDEVQVMVATSAFGMGVDKSDVKLVIHYDISNSLENYVQEAGRAGRDPSLNAKCYVLFSDSDLEKHFAIARQTKLTMSEISQVWRAIKELTKEKSYVRISQLELAIKSGWAETPDIETRIKIAIGVLEEAGYVKRNKNMSKIYATGIMVKSVMDANKIIDEIKNYSEDEKENAKRIISDLISRRYSSRDLQSPTSRVDYLADRLGLHRNEVLNAINLLRDKNLLADMKDMATYMKYQKNRAFNILEKFEYIERYILKNIRQDGYTVDIKELKEKDENLKKVSTNNIKDLLNYLAIKKYIKKNHNNVSGKIEIYPTANIKEIEKVKENRSEVCKFILEELYKYIDVENKDASIAIEFSLVEMYKKYSNINKNAKMSDIEDGLLYLSRVGIISLEGGFLVLYNTVDIKKLVGNRMQYKLQDYKVLSDYYKQKIQQIHIVGEYARMMVQSYEKALKFVQDYFQMDFNKFIKKYFVGREKEIDMQISLKKYNDMFGVLSDRQKEIIDDANSKFIVVAAGPGSGKTKVLVHKLASLLLMENVKPEQLLMLTFSRAAATEFKKRLMNLIGMTAHFVQIKTFHSYCFDIVERHGDLKNSDDVAKDAIDMIISGEVDVSKITKSVIVIDEAQDMKEDEYELVQALISMNDDIRVILVGDDDQNIYEFRKSSSKYMINFITEYGAKKYELIENYRSKRNIVDISNKFVKNIKERMKKNPSIANDDTLGEVLITKYSSMYMEEAVVQSVIKNISEKSVCVLTNSNEEALKIHSLMIKNGVKSKIIQTNDGFNLYNLAEVRYFLKQLYDELSTSLISNDAYEKAIEKLKDRYKKSICLENCLRMLDDFYNTNKSKYKGDLEEFIRESNYEDFYSQEENTVFVSTIHKSKGREFDTVHMMLGKPKVLNDEEFRKIYVGISRAKENLYIHCNHNLFDNLYVKYMHVKNDYSKYDEIKHIILQLGYKDVNLGFFKDKKSIIYNLVSGYSLDVSGVYFNIIYNGKKEKIAQFSREFANKVKKLEEKGYVVCGAKIRFVLMWKSEDMEEEIPIMFPNLYMKKM